MSLCCICLPPILLFPESLGFRSPRLLCCVLLEHRRTLETRDAHACSLQHTAWYHNPCADTRNVHDGRRCPIQECMSLWHCHELTLEVRCDYWLSGTSVEPLGEEKKKHERE